MGVVKNNKFINKLLNKSVKNKIPSNIRLRLEHKKTKGRDYSKLLFIIK